MTLTIKRTGARDYGQYVKALICGDPGAGKTLISSTFPNPLFASAEGGLMSLAKRNIPYVEIKQSDDLLKVKYALDQDALVRRQTFGFPVDTVVIDTIDEVQRILIRERLTENKKEAMQLGDWGWLGEQMQALIRGFRNLDLNVVMTCHLKESQDSESGRVWFEPGLQGAIGKQISAYVDLALLLRSHTTTQVVNDKAEKVFVRTLVTRPDTAHSWIKDRSGSLPAEIEVNFTDDYARIAELIYGDVDELPEGASTEANVESTVEGALEAQLLSTQATTKATTISDSSSSPAAPTPAPTQETIVDIPAQKPEEPTVEAPKVCVECGEIVGDDQADLSRIRFRKIMCREHFMAAKRK